MHLLYPVDLPNDEAAHELVKGALAGLSLRFDTSDVKVDQAVHNAGRITKACGSVANKGDHTDTAPWRLSRIVHNPGRARVVAPAQLLGLHPATKDEPAELAH